MFTGSCRDVARVRVPDPRRPCQHGAVRLAVPQGGQVTRATRFYHRTQDVVFGGESIFTFIWAISMTPCFVYRLTTSTTPIRRTSRTRFHTADTPQSAPGKQSPTTIPKYPNTTQTLTNRTPRTHRLVHHALAGSLRLIDDSLKALPGPHFEYTQGFDDGGKPAVVPVNSRLYERRRERALRLQSEGKPPARGGFGKRPVCVVFFVGGAFLLFSHHRLPV